MAQFEAFAQGVEVSGQGVLSVVDGMGRLRKDALRILTENGIPSFQPGQWYPLQALLDTFKAISESLGPHTLYCIGTKIPEDADFPPNIQTLEEAMRAIDIAYHMNHRGGDIGQYAFHKAEDGSMRFTCRNPYPCEFDRGIIEGMARKFLPPNLAVVVRHDDDAPCRENGDDSCTYHIVMSPQGG